MNAELRIQVQCPYCDKTLNIDTKYAGKWGKCGRCGKPIEVPKLESPKQEPSILPIMQTKLKSTASQILCEKCGGPMKKSRMLKHNGITIGCLGFALVFVSIFLLWPLAIVGAIMILIGMFPGYKKIMRCTRCGFFYECV